MERSVGLERSIWHKTHILRQVGGMIAVDLEHYYYNQSCCGVNQLACFVLVKMQETVYFNDRL